MKKSLFRILILASLVLLPLFGAAPALAQTPGFWTGNGSEVVELTYTLSAATAGFCFDFLRSADTTADVGDTLLSQYCVGAMGAGTYTLMLTLGTDMDLVTDATEVTTDYYLLADYFENTYVFEGVYQYTPFTDTAVFVHGTDGADNIYINGTGVNLNGAPSGQHNQISSFRVRAHAGDDLVDGYWGAPGASTFVLGAAGDDTLKPSYYGAILLDGGVGTDTFSVNYSAITLEINLNTGFAGWGPYHANLANIENAVGGSAADRITGDGNNNVLDGQGGADIIYGFGGNDTLLGGPGYDSMWGGDGDDIIRAMQDGAQMWGDAGNDSIRGSDVADLMMGGDGDDDLWPALGADTIRGDAGVDTVDFFHPFQAGGVYVDLSAKTATDQGGAVDAISTVENVLGTPFADFIQGDWAANFISGRAGNDELFGLANNDVIWGGPGADIVDGGLGAGDDILYGNDPTCVDDLAVDFLFGGGGVNDQGWAAIASPAPDTVDPTVEFVFPCP
ncbi:MAG: hypothetical protein P8129_16910 [Anaerolineae bacterium]